MRVLVVEDETKVARFLKQALEEAGHAVDVAGDGVEGGNPATINPYDRILLDVWLPRMEADMRMRFWVSTAFTNPVAIIAGHGPGVSIRSSLRWRAGSACCSRRRSSDGVAGSLLPAVTSRSAPASWTCRC
ncbi:MAG: response regulator [Gemmatimonadota bacterium]